jgi:hypothetical protein
MPGSPTKIVGLKATGTWGIAGHFLRLASIQSLSRSASGLAPLVGRSPRDQNVFCRTPGKVRLKSDAAPASPTRVGAGARPLVQGFSDPFRQALTTLKADWRELGRTNLPDKTGDSRARHPPTLSERFGYLKSAFLSVARATRHGPRVRSLPRASRCDESRVTGHFLPTSNRQSPPFATLSAPFGGEPKRRAEARPLHLGESRMPTLATISQTIGKRSTMRLSRFFVSC